MKCKKILLATNMFPSNFSYKLVSMLGAGLKGIEIYPEFVSEISQENVCIVAYAEELPEDVFNFIKMNGMKEIYIFLTHDAIQKLGEKKDELGSVIVSKSYIRVVGEVGNYLDFLAE